MFESWFSYVWGLGILTFTGLVFLRLGVRDSYVYRLSFVTYGGLGFLRLGVSFLTFVG